MTEKKNSWNKQNKLKPSKQEKPTTITAKMSVTKDNRSAMQVN